MNETQENANTGKNKKKEKLIPFATFLEEYPTGTQQTVKDFYDTMTLNSRKQFKKCTPVLRLYCGECNGTRNFDGKWTHNDYVNLPGDVEDDFLVYTCRDCDECEKHYCLFFLPIEFGNGEVMKIGEYPELNIKIPTSLPKLLGKDYPYFIKGLKCEKRGLGVGAYTYYRRVVENQKNRLFGEVLKVAQKLDVKKEMIQTIEKAIKEVQFSKAVDMIKDALPESLLIDGHNPFKLLHKALSIGIHNQSDEKCLELAHNIRIVLTDLSERINIVLSEKRDLQSSVSSLLKFNQEKNS
jgi:hypothetical protein